MSLLCVWTARADRLIGVCLRRSAVSPPATVAMRLLPIANPHARFHRCRIVLHLYVYVNEVASPAWVWLTHPTAHRHRGTCPQVIQGSDRAQPPYFSYERYLSMGAEVRRASCRT